MLYRCILTNDWDNSEKAIIKYYNKRGASERNFDCQNNDFGWAHLPFSFLYENTVFMIATAILKNYYLRDMLILPSSNFLAELRVKKDSLRLVVHNAIKEAINDYREYMKERKKELKDKAKGKKRK